MSLPDDLLAQARDLASKELKKPKQASVRRAISTAYYALFHLLIDDASRFVVAASSKWRLGLRLQVSRAFEHGHMKDASRAFVSSSSPVKNAWLARVKSSVPVELRDVADTFVQLQQERHEADYNVERRFERADAHAAVTRAENAFKKWRSIRKSEAAEAFMLALLLKGRT